MIGKRDKVEQSGTFNDDSESDWSLTGDWQRIVSLIIAIAYVVLPVFIVLLVWLLDFLYL